MTIDFLSYTNMHYSFFSLYPLLILGLSQQICYATNDAIFEGVAKDDMIAIKSVVESDLSMLEAVGPGGQTPLLNAVLTGKLNAVKTLLNLGANTAATEKDGYNVLHATGFQGRSEILEVLLKHFASQKEAGSFVLDPVTDKHRDGFYPIHRACWGNEERHTETVKVFLKNGVSSALSADNGMACLDMTKNEGAISEIQKGSKEL